MEQKLKEADDFALLDHINANPGKMHALFSTNTHFFLYRMLNNNNT